MSCAHPMILINTADMTDPKQRAIIERLKMIHKNSGKSMSTLTVPRELAIQEGMDLRKCKAVPIPCGQCIGCRLDYSRIWAERSIHEAKCHEFNYFLTLTYDDEHLPLSSKSGIPTLIKDEISSFMKRFRTAMKRQYNIDGIRFFGCGEIGTSGERGVNPHYHIILFNCPIPDLQERHPIPVDGKIKWIRQYDSNGALLQYSPLIGKCWQKGTAEIGLVSFESCAYVARYIVKKQKGAGAKIYKELGVEPEYVRMSRDPGIGYEWFMEHLDEIYECDNYSYKRGDDVITVKPSRYVDKLLQKKDEQKFYDIKAKRRNDFYDSVDCKDFEGMDFKQNLLNQEAALDNRIKVLKRKL